MARRLISLRLDPALIEAAREVARRERRSLGNLVEVALERYIRAQRGAMDTMAGQEQQVYVYRHQDDHTPVREAGPMALAEAEAYIRERAVDEYGNLSWEPNCPYLYIADHEGRALED